jgi:hypothetical protein
MIFSTVALKQPTTIIGSIYSVGSLQYSISCRFFWVSAIVTQHHLKSEDVTINYFSSANWLIQCMLWLCEPYPLFTIIVRWTRNFGIRSPFGPCPIWFLPSLNGEIVMKRLLPFCLNGHPRLPSPPPGCQQYAVASSWSSWPARCADWSISELSSILHQYKFLHVIGVITHMVLY